MNGTSLVFAAADRKHRPPSHPVVAARLPDEGAFYRHIAGRIRMLRTSRGLSQRELGERVGVSAVAVCYWEHGTTRPSAWHIDRLERSFGAEIRP